MAFPLTSAWKKNFADEGGFAAGATELALPGTRPTWKRVRTPVAEGVRITMRTTLPGSDAEVIMSQTYLHTEGSVYIVAYTTSPVMTKTYNRVFNRSVRSLREV
jgi:hypothetical protein